MNRTLLNRIALILGFAGLFVAGFVGMSHMLNLSIPCGASGGCDAVDRSAYSKIFGIPVSYFGMLAYAALTGLGIVRSLRPDLRSKAIAAGTIISALGTIVSFILIYIAIFFIQKTCYWCIASASIMTLTLFTHGLMYQFDSDGSSKPALDKMLVGVLAVVLVGGLTTRALGLGSGARLSNIANSRITEFVPADAHIMGPKNAPCTIVEFGDITCPHCRESYKAFKTAIAQSQGRFRFIFRHFPLYHLQGHQMALSAAAVSELAAEKGKFWQFLDLFFNVEDAEKITADDIYQMAEQCGLKADEVSKRLKDVNDPIYDRIHRDMDQGSHIGISSTPTFIMGVDGYDHIDTATSVNIRDKVKEMPYIRYINTNDI